MQWHRTPGRPRAPLAGWIGCLLVLLVGSVLGAVEPPTPAGPAEMPDPPGLRRLKPGSDVWFDTARKRVVLRGKVCLREGPLELFACRDGTKEHEAIVAVRTEAMVVHAALLAAGAEPGGAAQFTPEFIPARGTTIDIRVLWTDAGGKRRQAQARDWIRHAKTRQALDMDWVFAGSGFWENATTGERHYLGEDGDLICVANFPSAVLDLPIESSQAAGELLFDAFTERIPPLETPVTLLLIPRPIK